MDNPRIPGQFEVRCLSQELVQMAREEPELLNAVRRIIREGL